MNNLKTNHFQLDDSSLEILSANGQPRRLNYGDIDLIQIRKDSKFDFKKFSIIYWTTWLTISQAFLILIMGMEFIIEIIGNFRFWGFILALGLLAWRPFFSMLPNLTFMNVHSKSQVYKILIEDIVHDDRIHKLIEKLREKLHDNKIRIKDKI